MALTAQSHTLQSDAFLSFDLRGPPKASLGSFNMPRANLDVSSRDIDRLGHWRHALAMTYSGQGLYFQRFDVNCESHLQRCDRLASANLLYQVEVLPDWALKLLIFEMSLPSLAFARVTDG